MRERGRPRETKETMILPEGHNMNIQYVIPVVVALCAPG